MTLRLVLAAYGLESVRPYRVGAGRNNEHWYVGPGLVRRRYGPFLLPANDSPGDNRDIQTITGLPAPTLYHRWLGWHAPPYGAHSR